MSKFTFLLAFMPLMSFGQLVEKNFIDQNYIEVTGKSEMLITPDLIYIRVIINERDNKNKTPLADREAAMLARLKEIGIEVNRDVQIKDIASNFRFYVLAKTDILLTKEYQVLVRDGKMASRVFVELEKLEISNVEIEKVDHSEIKRFERENKIEAIKAAREKALALAGAIGQTAGRALLVREGGPETYLESTASNQLSLRSAVHRAIPEEPSIDFEKIRIVYSVFCRFELK